MRLAALLAALVLAAPAAAQDPIVDYAADDPAMGAAVAAARGTLDGFLARLDTGVESPLLKVAFPFPAGDGHEHIWVEVTGRDGDAFDGVLTNEPAHIDARAGDPVSFDRAAISDWMHVEEGLIHGAYTLRAMLPDLAPDEAADWRDALAPLPEE